MEERSHEENEKCGNCEFYSRNECAVWLKYTSRNDWCAEWKLDSSWVDDMCNIIEREAKTLRWISIFWGSAEEND